MKKQLLKLLILAFLMGLSLTYGRIFLAGWLFAAVYFWLAYKGSFLVFTKIFGLNKDFYTKIISVFANLAILSFVFNILFVFSFVGGLAFAVSLFLAGVLFLVLENKLAKSKDFEKPEDNANFLPQIRFARDWTLSLILVVLIAAAFFVLRSTPSQENILTPWQTIPVVYLLLMFLIFSVVGVLIFSRQKAITVLFWLILISFLFHSYLPLTHLYFYGADNWRHLAIEERIISGLPIDPTPADSSSNIISNFNIGKVSYGNFWLTTVFISRILFFGLVFLNKWMLPLMSALLIPILLFFIGHALGFGKRLSLLVVSFSFLPFGLQALPSMSLPTSFGFLIWLLGMLLLARRLFCPQKSQIYILAGFVGLSLFGYALYFVLLVLAWVLVELILFYSKFKTHDQLFAKKNLFFVGGITILLALIIPALELIAKYSFVGPVNLVGALKQFVGNLFGLYLAFGPRPHDISTGNILFNQTPASALVRNIFNKELWLVPIFAVIFWGSAFWGVVKSWQEKNKQMFFVSVLTLVTFLSYFISRYILSGEAVLARRLDTVLAALSVILFVYGGSRIINYFIKTEKAVVVKHQIILLTIIVLGAWAICLSYSLGPDTFVASKDQVQAARFIASIEINKDKHCVLGDTYTLLALEAASKKEIVGGGWPINEYFSQTLKDDLLEKVKNSTDTTTVWNDIKNNCAASSFWVVGDSSFAPQKFGTDKIINQGKFDKVLVWEYN